MSMPSHFILTFGGICTAIAGIVGLGTLIWKFARRANHLIDDILGENERTSTGEKRKKGWGERLGDLDNGQLHIINQVNGLTTRVIKVEGQFEPDHGLTMHDRVVRIERKLDNQNGNGS